MARVRQHTFSQTPVTLAENHLTRLTAAMRIDQIIPQVIENREAMVTAVTQPTINMKIEDNLAAIMRNQDVMTTEKNDQFDGESEKFDCFSDCFSI
jgi:hypothetical protein